MATNEILPFASTDTGTNLLTQAEYSTDSQRPIGNQPGIARSKLVNKALRQSSLVSAGVAQYIANKQAANVVDTLTTEQLATLMENAVAAQITAASALSLPTGSLIYYAGSVAPAGYLEANGALLSRTTYAALFAAIGIIYNAGDGSTTFGLPDLRGEFIRGWDNGRGIDAGRLIGSWQGDAIRNITGTFGGYTANNWDRRSGAFTSDLGTLYGPQNVDNSSEGQNTTTFDASKVVPTANENRPRNVAALICIKY